MKNKLEKYKNYLNEDDRKDIHFQKIKQKKPKIYKKRKKQKPIKFEPVQHIIQRIYERAGTKITLKEIGLLSKKIRDGYLLYCFTGENNRQWYRMSLDQHHYIYLLCTEVQKKLITCYDEEMFENLIRRMQ